MKVFFHVLIMVCVVVILFFMLNYGYYRGGLKCYDAVGVGNLTYCLNSKLRFVLLVLVFNMFFYFFGKRFLLKVKSIGNVTKSCILIILCGVNVINGFAFAVENYISNYCEVSELNVFPELLDKYGVVVNLIFIAPLILSVLVFCVFIRLLKRIN
ncbi:hypothetical protein PGR10_05400 [Klebsiella sp. 141198]|uniref:hypothetical protein n=1 Tax=Klebsiella sp. 141198 TaxID=3020036 RepID=UPI003D34B3DE